MSVRHRVPAYKHHRPSGQARVIVRGKHIYLGQFGSAASREKYARLIAELASVPEDAPVSIRGAMLQELSVNEMLLAYWGFAQGYYTRDGKPTKELACMRDAMRTLRLLYGESDVRDFGPLAIKAVRTHMIEVDKLSRGVINSRVNRIRRIFKWAVSEELIPVANLIVPDANWRQTKKFVRREPVLVDILETATCFHGDCDMKARSICSFSQRRVL